uniref:AMP-binding enzyme n=1 Tax=Pseudomonas aeruginosa TaxID=287 RepID=UPI0035C0E992
MLAHDGVGGTQLVGYVVADSAEDAERLRESLRESLKRYLPDYMVPAHLMLLERMTLTVNGKLDRQALPQPDASLSQQAYRAPGSELEQRIAAIWAEILGVERVGWTTTSSNMGGHSLLLLMSRSGSAILPGYAEHQPTDDPCQRRGTGGMHRGAGA